MKRLVQIACALGIAFAPVAAQAQAASDPSTPEIQISMDTETGERVASSVAASELARHTGRYVASAHIISFWIEARESEAGDLRVLITGERVTWRGLSDTPERGKFGPWDPKDPVYVGRKLKRTDVLARWSEIGCIEARKYCSQIDALDIPLAPETVSEMIAADAPENIKIALTRRNKVDYRIPKAQLIATLDALGVLDRYL